MRLFHVSNTIYASGDQIGPFDLRPPAPGDARAWIDEFLDSCKPGHARGRGRSVFAFASAEEAAYFGATQRLGRMYEVEFDGLTVAAPIVLVGRLEDLGSASGRAAALATEYWRPSQPWEVLEHMGKSCRVLRPAKWPETEANFGAQCSYENDRALARTMFPR